MHGLINKSLESFFQDTYGAEFWTRLRGGCDPLPERFEAMLNYPDAMAFQMLDCAADLLEKEREDILEDLGTYLVSHPHYGVLRRLLRFSGDTFEDFLYSLDELPDRVKLAVSDLNIGRLSLVELNVGEFRLEVRWSYDGFGYVMLGLLRALADDYGSLVFLDHFGTVEGAEHINIQLLDAAFADGNEFSLMEESA
ncbi:MAG: heme NO-binding domain-containing protein [Halocynthiibacter sp.]